MGLMKDKIDKLNQIKQTPTGGLGSGNYGGVGQAQAMPLPKVVEKPAPTVTATSTYNSGTVPTATSNALGLEYDPNKPTEVKQPDVKPAPIGANVTGMINDLATTQTSEKMAALALAKQRALSQLEAEKSAIAPAYYDKRNQSAALSQQQARNFGEYMANRGQTNAGISAQGELMRGNALQGQIGALNQQEAQAIADIERRRTDINNAESDQQIQAISEIAAQKMQNLINQANQNVGYGFQQAQLTGVMPDGTQTLAKQDQLMTKDQWERQFAEAQLQNKIGNFGVDPTTGIPTMAGIRAGLENQGIKLDNQGRAIDNQGKIITNRYLEPQLIQALRSGAQKIKLADIEIMNEQQKAEFLPKFLNQEYDANQLKNIGAQIANDISKLNLGSLPEQLKLTIAKAKQDLDQGELNIANLRIQNSNLDEKLKAEIAGVIANTAQGWEGLKIQQQNADTARINATTKETNAEAKKSPYYAEAAKRIDDFVSNLAKETMPDNITTKDTLIAMPDSAENIKFINMVEGANITPDEREAMYRIYGVPFPKK